ncbi:MAG: hypothetical protein GF353_07215 [Candidatus Lokiarchaeota archaeon]|nr:hypothetical protein [Candidatus Lokiarchaeota archaeon]
MIILSNLYYKPLKAYPGFGNCINEHPKTNIEALFYENSNINLDGIPNETFWIETKNQEGFLNIPTAPIEDNSGNSNISVNFLFAFNNEYLFIYCEWLDNTTMPSGIQFQDGIYFCWNIDVPEFTAYYPSLTQMDTSHMGGGSIDSWGAYFIKEDNRLNQSEFYGKDNCLQESGWHIGENNDVKVGLSYVDDHSYSLEIRRKLTTNDRYDVQFNEQKPYLFNIGVMDNCHGEHHQISWVYAMSFVEEEDEENEDAETSKPQLNIGFLIINITIIAISTILMIFFYYSKKNIK